MQIQFHFYNLIADSQFYFLDGPGGSGKTFLYNVILSYYRAFNQVALDGGTTAHSRFRIPIHEDSVCGLSIHSDEAQYIKQAKIIIWDEAPMCNRYCFESVDRFLRDLMNNNKPFGGKKFLIGGDFRQCLPVVLRGNRADIVNSSLRSSHLWQHVQRFRLKANMRLTNNDSVNYKEFLLQVGDGLFQNHTIETVSDYIELPTNIYMPLDKAALFNTINDSFANNYFNPQYINQRAILCPLNANTDEINAFGSDQLPGNYTTYLSLDSIQDDEDGNNQFSK